MVFLLLSIRKWTLNVLNGCHSVTEGDNIEINCSAIVGPQYDNNILQPVKAYWKNDQVSLKHPQERIEPRTS